MWNWHEACRWLISKCHQRLKSICSICRNVFVVIIFFWKIQFKGIAFFFSSVYLSLKEMIHKCKLGWNQSSSDSEHNEVLHNYELHILAGPKCKLINHLHMQYYVIFLLFARIHTGQPLPRHYLSIKFTGQQKSACFTAAAFILLLQSKTHFWWFAGFQPSSRNIFSTLKGGLKVSLVLDDLTCFISTLTFALKYKTRLLSSNLSRWRTT